MAVKIANLAPCTVGQCIFILSGYRQQIITPKIDTNAVVQPGHFEYFGATITCDTQHFKVHDNTVAVLITIAGWELTVDAAADIDAFGLHTDGFSDHHRRVRLDLDIAVEGQYPFLGLGCRTQPEHTDCKQAECNFFHQRSSTVGLLRWLLSSTSKYSAGWKFIARSEERRVG